MASSGRNRKESDKGIERSGGRCVICGWCKTNYKNEPLVIGAHVHDYSDDKSLDKYDDIIALCPNHHAQFDGGVLTIDVNGIIHSLNDDEYNGKKIVGSIAHIKKGYIDYHNKLKYKGEL